MLALTLLDHSVARTRKLPRFIWLFLFVLPARPCILKPCLILQQLHVWQPSDVLLQEGVALQRYIPITEQTSMEPVVSPNSSRSPKGRTSRFSTSQSSWLEHQMEFHPTTSTPLWRLVGSGRKMCKKTPENSNGQSQIDI